MLRRVLPSRAVQHHLDPLAGERTIELRANPSPLIRQERQHAGRLGRTRQPAQALDSLRGRDHYGRLHKQHRHVSECCTRSAHLQRNHKSQPIRMCSAGWADAQQLFAVEFAPDAKLAAPATAAFRSPIQTLPRAGRPRSPIPHCHISHHEPTARPFGPWSLQAAATAVSTAQRQAPRRPR